MDKDNELMEAMKDHDMEGCGKVINPYSTNPPICGQENLILGEIKLIYCKTCQNDFIQEGESNL